jgi:hypothetical protein
VLLLATKIQFETLPKVVAIVGSRKWAYRDWVYKFVDNLKEPTIVVSGGAIGVDTFAFERVDHWKKQERRLHYKGFDVENFEWELLGKAAGHARNEHVVRYCKRWGGIVIIFAVLNKDGEVEGGSKNVQELCEKFEVPYRLFTVTKEQNDERVRILRERRNGLRASA